MNKRWKKIRRWSILLIITGLLVFFLWPKPVKITYNTEKVASGSVEQIVSVTGSVESKPKINLQFKKPGTIKNILVKVGDQVSSGQLLATVDDTSLRLAVDQAQAGLEAAQANLALRQAGATKEDVALSQTVIDNATTALAATRTQYKNTQKSTAESLEKANLAVDNAETNLNNAKIQYDNAVALANNTEHTSTQNLDNAYRAGFNNIDSALFDCKTALTLVDSIIAVDQPDANSDFRSYLGVLDTTTKTFAQEKYRETTRELTNLNQLRTTISQESPVADQEELLTKTLQEVKKVKSTVHATYVLLTKSITGPNFSATALDNYKTLVSSAENGLGQDVTSLQNNYDTINNLKLSATGSGLSNTSTVANAKTTLDNANIALANTKKTLEQTKTDNQKILDNARADVELKEIALDNAQAAYRLKIAHPRPVDIASLEAQVKQAETTLAIAQSNLTDLKLTAPITGMITAINGELGENSASSPNFIEMISPELLVKANVSETDIAKINVGNKVSMTLDAFPLDQIFTGTIIDIDPAETVVQGVIYYKTTVQFDQNYPEIKSGMTANMDILANTHEGVLMVSPQAVQYRDNKPFVRLLLNGQPKEQTIQVGLEGNKKIEVKSGLRENDEVILYETNNTK